MRPKLKRELLTLAMLLILTSALTLLIEERGRASRLNAATCESEEFREQRVTPGLYEEIKKQAETADEFADILASTMLAGDFAPESVCLEKGAYLKYKPKEYRLLREAYKAVWGDIVYFPIPERNISYSEISYEDTFGEPRDYGGQRTHEGCDLFGRIKEPGYYPVLSMTDGVVENIGWLPLGGYRIGIRSTSGGYFYYAHLSGYEKEFKIGDEVRAGEILGFMGDTGYGPEGTRGRFPVHLHLGIYIKTPRVKELSVNPYWVLQAISKKIRN